LEKFGGKAYGKKCETSLRPETRIQKEGSTIIRVSSGKTIIERNVSAGRDQRERRPMSGRKRSRRSRLGLISSDLVNRRVRNATVSTHLRSLRGVLSAGGGDVYWETRRRVYGRAGGGKAGYKKGTADSLKRRYSFKSCVRYKKSRILSATNSWEKGRHFSSEDV